MAIPCETVVFSGMAQLRYWINTSLDGCIADSAGSFDWTEPDTELHAFFIDHGPRGPVITGIIDHERALWADPAVDFASLALLADITGDADFLAGYRDAGGPVVLDAATRYRLHLYRAHLALIMLVETAPRGTDGPEHHDHNSAVARWLTQQLDALEAGPPAGAQEPPHRPGHVRPQRDR